MFNRISLMDNLTWIANACDDFGLHKEANVVDNIMFKVATNPAEANKLVDFVSGEGGLEKVIEQLMNPEVREQLEKQLDGREKTSANLGRLAQIVFLAASLMAVSPHTILASPDILSNLPSQIQNTIEQRISQEIFKILAPDSKKQQESSYEKGNRAATNIYGVVMKRYSDQETLDGMVDALKNPKEYGDYNTVRGLYITDLKQFAFQTPDMQQAGWESYDAFSNWFYNTSCYRDAVSLIDRQLKTAQKKADSSNLSDIHQTIVDDYLTDRSDVIMDKYNALDQDIDALGESLWKPLKRYFYVEEYDRYDKQKYNKWVHTSLLRWLDEQETSEVEDESL